MSVDQGLIPLYTTQFSTNLELLLPDLHQTIAGLKLRSEVIVVDGGSRDGTCEVAERLNAIVVRQSEPGYGGALVAGGSADLQAASVTGGAC